MIRKTCVLKTLGKKQVKIVSDRYGVDFLIMKNGWQWSGFPVDPELLAMMKDAIDEYFQEDQK